jgi:uncharacterized membrane protein YccF (DUF307 family)
VTAEHADTPLMIVCNIVWLLVWGWVLMASSLVDGAYGITVIGIPFALQHLKPFRCRCGRSARLGAVAQ